MGEDIPSKPGPVSKEILRIKRKTSSVEQSKSAGITGEREGVATADRGVQDFLKQEENNHSRHQL